MSARCVKKILAVFSFILAKLHLYLCNRDIHSNEKRFFFLSWSSCWYYLKKISERLDCTNICFLITLRPFGNQNFIRFYKVMSSAKKRTSPGTNKSSGQSQTKSMQSFVLTLRVKKYTCELLYKSLHKIRLYIGTGGFFSFASDSKTKTDRAKTCWTFFCRTQNFPQKCHESRVVAVTT